MDLIKYNEKFIPAIKDVLRNNEIKTVKSLKSILRSNGHKFGDSYMTVLTQYKQIFTNEKGYLTIIAPFTNQTQRAFHSLAERINREDYTDGEKSNFEEKIAEMRALCILDYTYKNKYARHSVDRNHVESVLNEAIEQLKKLKKQL